MIVSSAFPEISSGKGFGFTALIAILFPKNSTVASAALSYTFLVAVLKAFIYVFVTASNNFLRYLLERFLQNDKSPHPLTYFLRLSRITDYHYSLIGSVKLTLFSISKSLPF